jgi:methionyl-tRNA formyltransferase
MRILILTQEDAFYIPRLLDHVLSRRRDVVAVGIVPGELRARNASRYLEMMGVAEFAEQTMRLAIYRLRDALSPLWPGAHSWSVAGAARRARVPCERIPKVNDPGFHERLRERGIDLIVSIACPQRFGPRLLALPPRGCINIHGALLPRDQGLLPSFWVLANGESETGVTIHWMSEEIDRGDLLLQERVAIEPADTMHTLVLRSKITVGRDLLVEAIERIERGDAPRIPMDPRQGSHHSFPDAASVARFRARGRRFV